LIVIWWELYWLFQKVLVKIYLVYFLYNWLLCILYYSQVSLFVHESLLILKSLLEITLIIYWFFSGDIRYLIKFIFIFFYVADGFWVVDYWKFACKIDVRVIFKVISVNIFSFLTFFNWSATLFYIGKLWAYCHSTVCSH
jgi:hypothetical protein